MNENSAVQLIPMGADPVRDAKRHFWADIKWRTLHCLIETSGESPISDLARKASLPIDETVRALEAMELMGVIKKTEKGYVQIKSYFTRDVVTKHDVADELSDFFNVSHQITNRILESTDPETVFTKRILYTSNKAVAEQLQRDIIEAIEKFKANSEQVKGKWDGIYAISVALTPMTEEV